MRRQKLSLWQAFLLFAFLAFGFYWGDKRGWWDRVRGRVEEGVIWGRIKTYKTYETHETYVGEEAKILSLEEKNWELEKENESLRKQLQAPLPAAMKFIPGRVLGVKCQVSSVKYQVSGIKCQEEELLLAVGKEEGVKEGMAVVLENILLGRVSEVTPRMSRVRLLASQESKVTVKTEKGARGLAVGNDITILRYYDSKKERNYDITKLVVLDKVLQSERLEVGEKVLTSGEDRMPADLLVGKVLEIISQEREPFKKAAVELFIEPGEVERVFVIKDTD